MAGESIEWKDTALFSNHRVAFLAIPVVVAALALGSIDLLSNSATTTTRQAPRAVSRPTPTATRAGVKHVCSSYLPSRLPTDIVARDRSIVPFSNTIAGVDATWADDSGSRSLEVVDGGYVDDVTEPYDGLHQIGTATVAGQQVEVDTVTLLARTVYVGLWREPQMGVPCDVHAVVTNGLARDEFSAILASLQPRAAVAAK